MFEGDADAPGANCSVTVVGRDAGTFQIKIRLSEVQARERLKKLCETHGVSFEKASDVKNVNYGSLRTQSELVH